MTQNLLYLFNPDHDLALANGDANYMPPASARCLATDLALLPVWYAEPNDRVLASSARNADWLNDIRRYFPTLPSLITEPEVANEDLFPSPWGWNPALHKRLHLLGVNNKVLPSAESLRRIKACSSRELAVRLLPQLQLNEWFCGESRFLTSPEDVTTFLTEHPVSVLKAPLSGSGKGLNWCRAGLTPLIANWCRNVMKQQGGVAAEPLYDKVVDFAMQFRADKEGRVSFRGYSYFYTSSGGAYEGNFLASDSEIERRLSDYVPSECLQQLKTKLEQLLALSLEGCYSGYLGVDMMIGRFPEGYRIHPCVEINLRMSMGMVARMLYERTVSPGETGVFRVAYYPSAEQLYQEHCRLEQEYPLELSAQRVKRGYLRLVPHRPGAQYMAYMLLK